MLETLVALVCAEHPIALVRFRSSALSYADQLLAYTIRSVRSARRIARLYTALALLWLAIRTDVQYHVLIRYRVKTIVTAVRVF